MMNDNKNIQGVTLIELLVVIGIMGVIGGFVYPTITDWQTNKNIERDLQAYIGLVDYVTNKTKAVGGTGMIYCEIKDENTTIVSYKISRYFECNIGACLDDSSKLCGSITQSFAHISWMLFKSIIITPSYSIIY